MKTMTIKIIESHKLLANIFSPLTKTSENGYQVWDSVIYREFNTNMTFLLKSKVEEPTLFLFIFYYTENCNKWIKEKIFKNLSVIGMWPVQLFKAFQITGSSGSVNGIC